MKEIDFEIETSVNEIDCEIDGKVEINAVPKEIRPLTVTENGTYDGGYESETQIGYSPITVAVPEPVIKPFTFTENGVFDISGKQFRYGETVTLKDDIDLSNFKENFTFRWKAGRIFFSKNGYMGGNDWLEYDVIGENKPQYVYITTEIAKFYNDKLNDSSYMAIAPCWVVGKEKQEKVKVTLPTKDEFTENTILSKENAEILFGEDIYENAGGANPITVAVKSKIEPITITENGTYTAEDCDGYSPIEVDVLSVAKLLNMKGGELCAYFFQGAKELQDGDLESVFANVENFHGGGSIIYCFVGCEKITKVPFFDTKDTNDFSFLFDGCISLKEVPLLDISKATNLTYFCRRCKELKTIPLLNTKNANGATGMFFECSNLEIIPSLDFRNSTTFTVFVNSCRSLKEIWIKNIKANLQVATGSSWGHLLTVESLIHLIRELRNTGSLKTLTVGSVNLEKLANVYVRPIEITDEMREQDDLIDEKLPFELCESTDEGACLITEYVYFKNWNIQ